MIKSKSQLRLMYSAMKNKKVQDKTGITPKVAQEFIDKTPKSAFSQLREKIAKKKY